MGEGGGGRCWLWDEGGGGRRTTTNTPNANNPNTNPNNTPKKKPGDYAREARGYEEIRKRVGKRP